MTQRKSNEGKVLDAVIRRIEERDGVKRADMRDPEAEMHPSPVDQVSTFGGVLHAFEHTEIEPFPDYIETRKHNAELLGPIPAALADLAKPDECFQLLVPITASVGLKRSDHDGVRAALVVWVRKEAPGVEPRPYGSRVTAREAQPPGVPFPVRLTRYRPAMAMGGRFDFVQVAPGGGDAPRVERIARACEKKYRKLAAWKAEEGARSIIVFEDNDMILTNEQLIADALVKAEASRSDCPDEAYVVATYVVP
ncbi:hypothetical protein [Methylocella sp.]|uniref:hypothetical protein n=1 Tax=Methylocella sp. TaxID=1978226 RepID=UPI003784661A